MSEIKERPILFSGPMVRAILEGRKTVTRRAIKAQPPEGHKWRGWVLDSTRSKDVGKASWTEGDGPLSRNPVYAQCPHGRRGDRLWVRETHADIGCRLTYRADTDDGAHCQVKKWTPAIHMFRRHSRILLEITDVRVERLQDITYEQAAAEGVHRGPLREWCASDEGGACHKYPVPAFRDLWQSVGGDWDANPWVWAVEFKQMRQ
ncbi:hypothetical protein ACQR3P_01640 [Rhodococcus sp. IEGM1300]